MSEDYRVMRKYKNREEGGICVTEMGASIGIVLESDSEIIWIKLEICPYYD